jgi:hypothetical protein
MSKDSLRMATEKMSPALILPPFFVQGSAIAVYHPPHPLADVPGYFHQIDEICQIKAIPSDRDPPDWDERGKLFIVVSFLACASKVKSKTDERLWPESELCQDSYL